MALGAYAAQGSGKTCLGFGLSGPSGNGRGRRRQDSASESA